MKSAWRPKCDRSKARLQTHSCSLDRGLRSSHSRTSAFFVAKVIRCLHRGNKQLSSRGTFCPIEWTRGTIPVGGRRRRFFSGNGIPITLINTSFQGVRHINDRSLTWGQWPALKFVCPTYLALGEFRWEFTEIANGNSPNVNLYHSPRSLTEVFKATLAGVPAITRRTICAIIPAAWTKAASLLNR